jgi:hypothetical protein
VSDFDDQMAEWRKTLWATGPCPDSSQENFTLTDEERFVLREVRDIYADEDDVKCNEIAAVIDGLLERTK